MALKLYGVRVIKRAHAWPFLTALAAVPPAPSLPSRPDAEVEPQTSEPKITPFNTPDALEKRKLAKAPNAELKDNHQGVALPPPSTPSVSRELNPHGGLHTP